MTAAMLVLAGFFACCAYMVLDELLTLGWRVVKLLVRVVRTYWGGL